MCHETHDRLFLLHSGLSGFFQARPLWSMKGREGRGGLEKEMGEEVKGRCRQADFSNSTVHRYKIPVQQYGTGTRTGTTFRTGTHLYCFPFSCLLTEGNKNIHRGLCQVNVVIGWPAEHHWRLESPRTLVRGRRLHHAWNTLGEQWLTYQSAITVFLSSSGMVGTWPNFAKKDGIICLEALLFLLNFTGGFSSGKTHTADCCFVSGSYWYTQGSVFSYDVLSARRPSSVTFS